jgi:hypothetical protein
MKLTILAIGAAAGYSIARVLEARAVGLQLDEAFKISNILKPVSAIRALLPVVTPMAQQSNQTQVIDVTPA